MGHPGIQAARLGLIALLGLAVPGGPAGGAPPARRRPAAIAASGVPLVDVRRHAPGIVVDLSYRRPDNAFRTVFYASNVALLRRPVAERLGRVQSSLRRRGLGLKVWDAYRPASVQWRLWKIRPNPRYLARPWVGSRHSRGSAVDVSLVALDGRALEMPTPHDEFTPRAHRGARRGVSPQARKNAELLRAAMAAQGFLPNRYEWWHFEAPRARAYPVANISLPRE